MGEPSDKRYGELGRGVLALLNEAPDGLAIEDVLDRLAVVTPPTRTEMEPSQGSVGGRRYEEAVRRMSATLARTQWLTKADGVWRITEKGRSALAAFPDPMTFYVAADRRRDPDIVRTDPPSDVGDIFASCFLTIGGSLVGAVIGTIVLFVRMLPEPSLGIIGGFVAALIVGFFVGLVASYMLSGFAAGMRRGEGIWVTGTALAAGVSAALTPSLMFPVSGGG